MSTATCTAKSATPKICPDCNQVMPANRYPNATYCVPCSAEQRKASFRRHDKKRAAQRREYARTPAQREANRKAVKKYSQTYKGIVAKDRAAANRDYKAYWAAYYAKNRDRILERQRAKRRRGGFEVFTDRRLRFSGKIRKRERGTTPRKDSWQDFVVPDYLK